MLESPAAFSTARSSLRLSGFERNAIEKKLVVGDAEQKARVIAFGSASCSSFHVVSNWPSVRLWSHHRAGCT